MKITEIANKAFQKATENIAKGDAFFSVTFNNNAVWKKSVIDAEFLFDTYRDLITNGVETYEVFEESKFLLLEGDIFIEGNLDLNWLHNQAKGTGVSGNVCVIVGNIYIKGDFNVSETNLLILGNVYCDCVYAAEGNFEIYGDLQVRIGLYHEGDYATRVTEEVNFPYLLCYAVGEALNVGPGDIIRIYEINYKEDLSLSENYSFFAETDLVTPHSRYIKSSLFTDNEQAELLPHLFFEMVRNGENPFVEIE